MRRIWLGTWIGLCATTLLTSCGPRVSSLGNYRPKTLQPAEFYKDFTDYEHGDQTPDQGPGSITNPPPVPGSTATPQPGSDCSTSSTVLCFPVAGKAHVGNDYGAPRDNGRKHAGNDIFAAKLTPVVAVDDGVVDRAQQGSSGSTGVYIGINHGNGMRTLYLHLNNDSPNTNDGKGHGIAPGIKLGARVKKGQLLGWVGNSGNAETTPPHLHFELRFSKNKAATASEDFVPVDPHKMLTDAEPYKRVLPMAYLYQ